ERELDLVAATGRCLRQRTDALHPTRETNEKTSVVLRLAAVQVPELRDDRLDVTAGDRLHKIEPVDADVRRGARHAAPRGVEAPVVIRAQEQPILQKRAAREMH